MQFNQKPSTMQTIQCKPWLKKRYLYPGLAFLALVCVSLWVRFESEKPQSTTLLMYGLEYKQILVWRVPNQKYQWPFTEGIHDFQAQNCPVNKCFFTYDTNMMQSSDAILFHSTDILKDDRLHDLLEERLPQQLWVFVDQDPPKADEDPTVLDGQFNIAMTYKIDSDIVVPNGASMMTDQLFQVQSLLVQRTGSVVWNVKDCELLKSKHISRLLDALQRQMSVSIFSQCPPDPDCINHPDQPKCSPVYNTRDYKFELIIETRSCQSYIPTEFWEVLRRGSVPIVFGASMDDYLKAAPPNSFLHLNNFTSPEQLVNHLVYLDANNDAYAKYFKWHARERIKTPGELSLLNAHAVCQLCEQIHDENKEANYYFMSKWWSADQTCLTEVVPFPSSQV